MSTTIPQPTKAILAAAWEHEAKQIRQRFALLLETSELAALERHKRTARLDEATENPFTKKD